MIYSDLQSLEPGRIIELYEMDLSSIVGEKLYFHGYT
jgi:phage-related protein